MKTLKYKLPRPILARSHCQIKPLPPKRNFILLYKLNSQTTLRNLEVVGFVWIELIFIEIEN